jgi:branched-chain amino acid:cation transporter, LIVCS family
MQAYQYIFIYGFAIFAMFFGSGNLVFPLEIGAMAGQYWYIGFLGLFLTGIILPFLGLFVIKLHRGVYTAFFAEAGHLARIVLPFFTLALLGSFGVVPRCITVAHGGLGYLFPQIPLYAFSIVFCVLTFLLCLKDKFMIQIIGKWMSPILLLAIMVLTIVGVLAAPDIAKPVAMHKAFVHGFLTGYQTMDLFAAFFFSALIFTQIKKIIPPTATPQEAIRFAMKPSLFGAGLLALVYLGFVYLGAHYADIIQTVAPEAMLPTIAMHTMGDKATLFIAVAMVVSCLTTAVALNNIFARYLCYLLTIKERYFFLVLLVTTSISFVVSLLNFRGIAAFLAPCLEVSYPGLIALTIMSIFFKSHKKAKVIVFYSITLLMIAKEIMRYFF